MEQTRLFKSLSDLQSADDDFFASTVLQLQYLSDIEMNTSVNESSLEKAYTSLKDILADQSEASMMMMNISRKDSWREIPMKDPLLQQAAWAYLQPVAIPESDPGLFHKIKRMCFRLFGCLSSALVIILRSWFYMGSPNNKIKI